MNTNNLKLLIFDLGGVILNLDINKTLLGFRHLFGEDFNIFEEAHLNESFFLDYEKGHIPCETFRDYLKKLAKTEVTYEQLDLAWNAMLEDLPRERIKWLEELKENYKICILSNTNIIHLEAFHKIFAEQSGYTHPDKLFDKLYYSCEMGMRKPDDEIYLKVLDDMQVAPHQALFFDDKLENIETARQLGINTVLVERNKLTRSLLPKKLKSA